MPDPVNHNGCALCETPFGGDHERWCPRVSTAPTHEAVQEAATAPKTSAARYRATAFDGDVCGPFSPDRGHFGRGPILDEDEPVAHERSDLTAEDHAEIKAALRGPVPSYAVVRRMEDLNELRGVAAALTARQPQEAPTALPTSALARKELPLATGLLDYFPAALVAVAGLSRVGNEQHNPGKPLHWDRSKSGDEADALLRHFVERGTIDTDGLRHSTKVAWRALALLQKELEDAGLAPLSRGSR